MHCPVCHSDYPADWKACPKDATLLLKSAQIGKYQVEGLLGVGGMGAVYRARNPDTKGRVAIKVMHPAVADAESARARFQREAAAVAALRTTHVVKVYDFGTEPDGTLYLVMELLDGHALRDEIAPAPNYMDPARVLMVMEGALKGLAAAHRAGIVHRDLKPDNVFVAETDDGEVPKLLDFGIARVRTGDLPLTRTGSLMGTAAYMASEQIDAGAREVGPWSDVYAMGAILYEMLAGSPAYSGTTLPEVLGRVLTAEVVPLAAIRGGLPDSIYALVERCMSVEPAKRPQDAEAMRLALHAAQLVPPGAAIPPARRTRVDAAAAASARSRDDVGLLATEGREPVSGAGSPVLPPGAHDQRSDGAGATLALAASGGGASASPGAMPAPAGGGDAERQRLAASGPGAVQPRGAETGAPASPPGTASTARIARPRSKLPLVLGGSAALGIAGLLVLRSTASPTVAAPPREAAAHAAERAAINAGAAPAAVETPAARRAPSAPPDAHPEMVRIPGGVGLEIGELNPSGDALARQKVTLAGFWIDRAEMTRGELEAALAGKLPAATRQKIARDASSTPARFVDWDTAGAACAAVGKRLPTEEEWEVAALTTPQDARKAKLLHKGTEADLIAGPTTDCSPAGLCDMLGGLHEWTATAGGAPATGREPTKIVRGASYKFGEGSRFDSIHARLRIAATRRDNTLGFRCVVSAP